MSKQYLYCEILPAGYSWSYWYIAKTDVAPGDYVLIPIGSDNKTKVGYVGTVKLVEEEAAPYPPEETKQIIRILRNEPEYAGEVKQLKKQLLEYLPLWQRIEKEEIKKTLSMAKTKRLAAENKLRAIQAFKASIETVPFIPDRNKRDLSEHLVSAPHTSVAVVDFCGTPKEVDKALEYITLLHDNKQHWKIPRAHERKLGVAGFTIWFWGDRQEKNILASIIHNAPNLKVAMFLERWGEYDVLLAYSRSGYPYITDVKVAGACDFHDEDRWTFHHTPTEASFRESVLFISSGETVKVNYRFPYLKDWEAMNFVFEKDGELLQIVDSNQSGNGKTAEKKNVNGTTQNELSVTGTASGPIAGKVFVVTGKLNHFANRDALKTLIQNNGAKLSESLNKDTHYLITNDPNSGSSKNQKARQLGIKVITEDEFINLLDLG